MAADRAGPAPHDRRDDEHRLAQFPVSKDGFGNKMREWCDEAGLPHCVAHDLPKAIARRMAEASATQRGIKAVAGWKGDSEVALDTAAAEQEELAKTALEHAIGQFSTSD